MSPVTYEPPRLPESGEKESHLYIRKIAAAAVAVAIGLATVFGIEDISKNKTSHQAQAPAVSTVNLPPERTERPSQCAVEHFTEYLGTGKNSSASFNVNKGRVIGPNGRLFVPYGISVYGGLQERGASHWLAARKSVNAQIEAAVKEWHSNTVRLQVSQTGLFNKNSRCYLNEMQREVSLINSLGAVAVINVNTEQTNYSLEDPDKQTAKFWDVIADHFKDQPYVIFDLFNEPRLGTYDHIDPAYLPDSQKIWKIWQDGGRYKGRNYVGMQQLVDKIRSEGANNLIWVETPYYATRLDGHYPIKGPGVEEAFHHIELKYPSRWDSLFGNYALSHAVVDGEWSQYASGTRTECYAGAFKRVPEYIKYLNRRHIGLIAWSLQPNSLVAHLNNVAPTDAVKVGDFTSEARLSVPDHLTNSYSCTDKMRGQGAGQKVFQLLESHSHRIPILGESRR